MLHVRADLADARASATALRDALTAGDQPAAEDALADLRESSESAADGTGGPVWSALGVLPVVGDDADGVRVVSGVLADLAADGLDPVVESARSLEAGSFTPRDGALDLDVIRSLERPLGRSRDAFAGASERLDGVDSSGFVGALRTPYDDLAGQVRDAAGAVDAAATATELLPSMLGGEEERTYLLVFQNNAELRSTGGMLGAAAPLTAEGGRIELGDVIPPADTGELDRPILPLTEDEQSLFFEQLGTYFQDANFTPDFPRAAELMAARWARDRGQEVDGVLAVDPVALSYLLEGTGPVEVEGVTITADNAVEEILNKPYIRIQDPDRQNEFAAAVAEKVFETVMAGTGSPRTMLSALARAAGEHRLLVHSFHEAEQSRLAGTAVAGELSDGVGVYLNDGTGSKMSYYLDHEVDVRATGCRNETQRLAGTMTLHADTPPGIADYSDFVTGPGDNVVPKGHMYVAAHLYAPKGGEFEEVVIDGKELDVFYEEHEGHQVASLPMLLEPGQERTVEFTMVGARGDVGDTEVRVTPGVEPVDESSLAESACALG